MTMVNMLPRVYYWSRRKEFTVLSIALVVCIALGFGANLLLKHLLVTYADINVIYATQWGMILMMLTHWFLCEKLTGYAYNKPTPSVCRWAWSIMITLNLLFIGYVYFTNGTDVPLSEVEVRVINASDCR